jgi:phage-related baseplate assembly protein
MADTTPTLITFVHEDGAQVIAESQAFLEQQLNRSIAPADIEMLLINALAYREVIIRTGLNQAARQNMVSFSTGAALEYLGELVGVTRLPAAAAVCSIQFNLVAGQNGVIIPQGTRVQSTDGKIIFQTIAAVVCSPGDTSKTVQAQASTTGAIGNAYAVNTINIILDPQAFIATAQNTDVTGGGSDDETDDELRDRIKLAPSTFSVAGPRDAYKFFAKSANPAIVDVVVTSPIPGTVNIYPLLDKGTMPTDDVLNDVLAICNADKIRPLTDTVVALSPTPVNYAIEVNLTLLTDSVTLSTQAAVQAALQAYVDARVNRIGLDVIRDKIIAIAMIDGVYDVEVVSPAANIISSPEQYNKCTGITVNPVGTHDE